LEDLGDAIHKLIPDSGLYEKGMRGLYNEPEYADDGNMAHSKRYMKVVYSEEDHDENVLVNHDWNQWLGRVREFNYR
jgi:hypothetical protein